MTSFELGAAEREELVKNIKFKWVALNSEYQTMIHRKQFGYSMLKKKESLEADMGRLEGYLKKLDKPVILVDTKDTPERSPAKNAQNYKTSIKL